MNSKPHPFTFPARPPPSPIAEEPSLSHEEQLARFRRSAAAANLASIASDEPPLRTLVSPTPGSPVTRHHLPSRLTTPQPIPLPQPAPVPVDNFAAPRSDSPIVTTGAGVFVPSHRKQDSSISDAWREKGSGRVEEDEYARTTVEGGSDTESRCRFTLGEDTYAYNARGAAGKEMMGGGGVGGMPPVTPKGAQGWEKEGGRRKKNVRMLWCLLVLAVVAIAIGVGVGVSRRNRDESSDPAQGVSASNSIPSSIVPSSATVDPRSTATVPLTTPSGTSLATSTLATPTTYSTSYAFASGSFTTTVPLTYTIPTSYDTRGNGQLQFTQEVVLPSLGAGARGSFTSELRFRVAQTQGPGVSRMRGKRHLKGRELR